jgi:hypothetical protein
MPFLTVLWTCLKFGFFVDVGLLLIIPVNLVILIRNLFPGHWRYRPFFLRHLYYAWLWIWRGEAPTFPFAVVRPLLNLFINLHFEGRLRRLRREILLRDDLSDAVRSGLLARLDVALEQWKSPKFWTFFFSALLPGIISFPTWYKQFIDWLASLGVHMQTEPLAGFVSNISPKYLLLLGVLGLGYLLGFPPYQLPGQAWTFYWQGPRQDMFPRWTRRLGSEPQGKRNTWESRLACRRNAHRPLAFRSRNCAHFASDDAKLSILCFIAQLNDTSVRSRPGI